MSRISATKMVRSALIALLAVLFAFNLIGLHHLLKYQQSAQPDHLNGTFITIIQNHIDEPKSVPPPSTSNTATSHQMKYNINGNEICLNGNCQSVHFSQEKGFTSFETKNYLVLHNSKFFLFAHKHIQHVPTFTVPKDIHLKYSRNPQYHSFMEKNDIFVYESQSLYAIYRVEQDNTFTQCLFLEKISANYTQHILADQNQSRILLLSFPRRTQIMVQKFDCDLKVLENMTKIAVDGWIKTYSYSYEDGVINVNLTTEAGFAFYTIDPQTLRTASFNEVQHQSSIIKQIPLLVSYYSQSLPSLLLQYTIDYFRNIKQYVGGLYKGNYFYYPKSGGDSSYSSYFGSPRFSFFDDTKMLTVDLKKPEAKVIALGEHLIKTNIAVFHNFENATLEYFIEPETKPQKIYYIEDSSIHEVEYLGVIEIHPNSPETQWMGFSRNVIDFYPKNPSPKEYRYARSGEHIMVLEGMSIKGKFKLPYNKYESYQTIRSKPQMINSKLMESHVLYTSFICTYEFNKYGNVVAVNLINGFNGRLTKSFDLGNIAPQDIYTYLEDNEFILAVYDRSRKVTRFTKLEGYVDTTSKQYAFQSISRQYQVPDRIILIHNTLRGEYVIVIQSDSGMLYGTVDRNQLSNRRPNLLDKEPTKIQMTIASRQLEPYRQKKLIGIFWVRVANIQSYESIQILQPETYGPAYGIIKQKQGDYLLVEVIEVDKWVKSRIEGRFKLGVCCLGLAVLPLYLIVCWWLNRGSSSSRQSGRIRQQNRDTNKQKKKESSGPVEITSTTKGQKSKRKKQQ